LFVIVKFEIKILGCGSATPTLRRAPTSQLINVQEQLFMIDCGEGTQLQLRKFKVKFQKINHIFISHLHGDHYIGLIGLISSMHLLGRNKELNIYCHPDLKKIIELQLKASNTRLNYEINYHYLNYDKAETIMENKVVEVRSIVLKHRISCCGFVFIEKEKERNISKEKIKERNVPIEALSFLKKGEDFTDEKGEKFLSIDLTTPANPGRKYAYCSDTAYNESIIEEIKNVDLLYHESTFLKVLEERAHQTYHSTAHQAALIAKKATVKQLMLGHFSARYVDIEPFKQEAQELFSNVLLAHDGLKVNIE